MFDVCHNCATAIINSDFSAFEILQDDVDTDYERVTAFVERHGYLVNTGHVNHPGYWECEACDQVEIGSGYRLEAI